ncbi:uncharacterized protein LOC125659940 [Ostrea edulis]|uniref:uncharacterized protein LOC125659940 n=1 Tax=Ostrea edulis TaxID=37623 RepID=UPI0024AFE491|nr:uncharacterized protein LOC125659940 [Ostrea edulis]
MMNTEICHAVICTTNLGLEYRSEQVPGNLVTFSINACCPCRSQPVRYQIPLCGLRNAIVKVNTVKTQVNNALRAFASSIAGGSEVCSRGRHFTTPTYDNITDALLASYQGLTGIALKLHIIQNHDNSRIGVISGISDDIGDTLCHLQSLLGDIEMSETIYKRSHTIAQLDISQMVPYTCSTLNENLAKLNNIEKSIRATLLRKLNDFA